MNKWFYLLFLCYTSAASIPRYSNGQIKRDFTARKHFMQQTGYPSGRKGYEVDHITPLYKGGCDTPDNMQWLAVEEHKRKTRE